MVQKFMLRSAYSTERVFPYREQNSGDWSIMAQLMPHCIHRIHTRSPDGWNHTGNNPDAD